jgi:hypothetical protein
MAFAPLRTVVGGRARDNTLASAGVMARFDTGTLSIKENLNQGTSLQPSLRVGKLNS